MAQPIFKIGEPRRPRGGKVRLLRRSVLGLPHLAIRRWWGTASRKNMASYEVAGGVIVASARLAGSTSGGDGRSAGPRDPSRSGAVRSRSR